MNISAESLRELHRIHRQLKDLRDRLDRGPKQIAAAEANVKKMEMELEQAKDASKKTRIRADQKQLQLKSREDKIKDLNGKLNQASSNREYQASGFNIWWGSTMRWGLPPGLSIDRE